MSGLSIRHSLSYSILGNSPVGACEKTPFQPLDEGNRAMSATARPRLASGSRLSAKQNDPTSLQNGNPAFNGVDNHPDFRRQGGQVQSLRALGRQELQESFKLPQTPDVVQRPYIPFQIGANIGAIPAGGVKMRLQQRFRIGTPQARLNKRHTRLQNQMLLARTTRSFFQAESERILAYRNEPTTRAFH